MIPNGIIFNAYPDSCGQNLSGLVDLLQIDEINGIFRYCYLLPSLFQSDMDRGFSVISYDLNAQMASREDLEALGELGLELKLDLVLNHLSVQSPQFQDLLEKGDESPYVDAFIDWNKFWDGFGEMSEKGYVIPDKRYLDKLFMRKPGLPILRIPFPDGSYRFYWNTFYQSVSIIPPEEDELIALEGVDKSNTSALLAVIRSAADTGTPISGTDFGTYSELQDEIVTFVERQHTEYQGQMDLNAQSDTVWRFYRDTFSKLAGYGTRIVRLDAFAYLHKEVDSSNFFNEPGTWEYLAKIREIADEHSIVLLPEIHSRHEENIHGKLAEAGYPIYDFFFPGLVIDAIESGSAERLITWISEIQSQGYTTVSMLGCHDGIPVLDMKGLLGNDRIEGLIDLITHRGGRVKALYGPDGKRIAYYQVNATFFSALGENEEKMLLARAIQLFMPSIPQVWYLDLFAGANDTQAADLGGHKEINRTNLSSEDVRNRMALPVVRKQLELLRFRAEFPAFGDGSSLVVNSGETGRLVMTWVKDNCSASLGVDLTSMNFRIEYSDESGQRELLLGVL